MIAKNTAFALCIAFCLATPATGQERPRLIRTVTWALNLCAASGDVSQGCVQRALRSEYVTVGQWMEANRGSATIDGATEMCRNQFHYYDLMDQARCTRAVVECVNATMSAQGSSACLARRLAVDLPEQVEMPSGN